MLREFAKKKDVEIDLITSSSTNKFEVEEFSKRINIYKVNVGKKDVHYWRQIEILRWLFLAYSMSRELMKKKEYNYCHCWFGFPPGLAGMHCLAA